MSVAVSPEDQASFPNPMVRRIYISPGHNYFSHHGRPPSDHPVLDMREIECVAGRGLKGDRFFDFKPDYKGQITFFMWENLERMWDELKVPAVSRDPSATRRNVLTEGLDLPSLIGREFAIQGVQFLGVEECRPCAWMNGAVHPDAEAWMKGRGGLRAKILSSGTLRVDTIPIASSLSV
jgi:MOSC domain-containing protein YiiM